MKKIWFRISIWQSALSILVVGVFAYLAISSYGGTSQQKRDLGNGVYEVAKTFSNGKQEVTTGRTDGYNNWHGPVKIEYLNDMGELRSTEQVNMINGKRHGESTITYFNGAVRVFCYDMGERVECEKSAMIAENSSAFNIFNYKYPWFAAKLNAFNFTEEYIRAFLDTFEIITGKNEFDISDFDSHYNDATEILEKTHYDSLIIINAELSLYNGAELINLNEFRLAAIDQQRSTDSSIYRIIKLKYPNYLLKLLDFEITESDFQVFGQVFDSLIYSYGPLNPIDPFFVDSIDARMFRAISFIASEEDKLIADNSLKSMVLSGKRPYYPQLIRLAEPYIQKVKSNKNPNPNEVATIITAIILMKFTEGDLVKRSIYEAFSLKKGIVNVATVTTGFVGSNSDSGVTIKGNVISNGGGVITSKGFYYGTVFNPDSANISVVVKGETESFETAIKGLSPGVTYYARAFAKNSAGTAYGNCISFTTNTVVGSEINELNEMVFDVFPNPAAGLATFRFNLQSAGKMEMVIVNMNGQAVIKKNLGILPPGENKIQLNVSNLENGIYSFRLIGNSTVAGTAKFIVAR